MTQIMLATDRLKTLRKARKVGRPKLAKLTGLTERQIGKLETAAGQSVSEAALVKLAQALDVPAEVLSGHWPIEDSDLRPAAQGTCSNGCCG